MADAALPPGPREPAALQTLEWIARPTAFLRRCAARHGEAFTVRLAFDDAPMVLLWHPDAVRAVFAAPADVLRRSGSLGPLAPVVGERSIIALDGPEHLRVRRLLLEPFRGDRMPTYRALVAELAHAAIDRWPRGRPVALLGPLQALTLDVILRAVLGVHDPRLAADIGATLGVARSLPRMAGMALTPSGLGAHAPWRGFLRRVAAIDARLQALIAARRADGAGGDDVLSLLIGAGLDDAELRDHLVTLIAAGHDTTAGALGWAVERLARDRAALERARTGEDAWLDAIARETLRIRPVLSVAPRRLVAPLRAGDRTLPAGVHVAPCIYLLHRRADLYPQPETWRPQRWLEGAPDGFAWIPFGGGVRRCLGAAFAAMEMREVLRAIAGRLDIAPDRPEGERMRRRGVTLQPGRGARVVLADARAG